MLLRSRAIRLIAICFQVLILMFFIILDVDELDLQSIARCQSVTALAVGSNVASTADRFLMCLLTFSCNVTTISSAYNFYLGIEAYLLKAILTLFCLSLYVRCMYVYIYVCIYCIYTFPFP